MFTFHKHDAFPRSRQSSIDSPVTGTLSSAPASDTWTSQSSTGSSHGAMQSPEKRHRAYSGKRSSMFNLRSRSNTATSTTSSLMSLSPSDMGRYEMPQPGSPLPLRQDGSQRQVELSGPMKSLFRGKKGKRLSESVPFSIGDTEYDEVDVGGKRTSVLRKGRRRNNQPEIPPVHDLKHRISSPFDFQHLTHTNRHQLATLEEASGDKLAAGFRAVRASQQPSQNLIGTRADDWNFSNFSSENLATPDYRSPSVMSFTSPSQSPKSIDGCQEPDIVRREPTSRPTLRLTRSVESFSPSGAALRNYRHSQSIAAPPRLSSLLPPIDDTSEDLPEPGRGDALGRSRSRRGSGLWDSFSLAVAPPESQLSGVSDDSSYFGYALTTPDDTAIQAMTPPLFSPSLEDVAEEPERFVRPRAALRLPVKTPTSPLSPSFDSNTSTSQGSPMGRPRNRGDIHSSLKSNDVRSPRSRPMSQMPEIRCESARRLSAVRRKSNTWRVPEESWEDDIDYIYENALEADCDFEWDRVSDEETCDVRRTVSRKTSRTHQQNASKDSQLLPSAFQADSTPQAQFSSYDFRASLLVPDNGGLPDLEPTSATSASTIGTRLPTPVNSFKITPVCNAEDFVLSPSLLIPQEYKDNQEALYEDLLNEYDGTSERHFTMIDPSHSATSSTRSSRFRSSRRSSSDSSLMSSAQSSGLWSSPVRRSASSAGSVPELVPSRRTRRDLSFSLMIDQLSDSVASLKHLDEEKEDDDITPPGHPLGNRTFFSENDTNGREIHHSTIEDELKNSLELARRGSQRNEHSPVNHELEPAVHNLARPGLQRSIHARARHHKQALSDGAAKVLATEPAAPEEQLNKPRNRAATTSQTTRQPMLSLFPSPPRYSYTPNHT